MEIVPQHVYNYNDGLPAYKSGEWPGKRSSFWKGSKLILKPLSKRDGCLFSEIRGQKHFPQRYSSEYQYKAGKKLIKPTLYLEEIKSSKRVVNPVFTEPKVYPRNIGIRPPDQINGTSGDAKMFESKRHFQFSFKVGISDKETNVEKLMTRKKRIEGLNQQRNGFDVYFPGEKRYKCVENDTDFFKLEGITVGSTHRPRNMRTQTLGENNFYYTLDVELKTLDPDKVYKSKTLRESLDNDKTYVKSLDNWEETHISKEEIKEPKAKN